MKIATLFSCQYPTSSGRATYPSWTSKLTVALTSRHGKPSEPPTQSYQASVVSQPPLKYTHLLGADLWNYFAAMLTLDGNWDCNKFCAILIWGLDSSNTHNNVLELLSLYSIFCLLAGSWLIFTMLISVIHHQCGPVQSWFLTAEKQQSSWHYGSLN